MIAWEAAPNRRIAVFSLFSLLLVLAGSRTEAAEAEKPFDPWRFPGLVERKPFQRAWWEFQQRAYPLNEIPQSARLRALEQIERWRAGPPPEFQPVPGNGWLNIGPAPIIGGDNGSSTRPISGRIADIAVDPASTAHWLIGAAQGGIWETRDSGTTWKPLTDGEASLAMGAVAFAPSNPSIIYAGTGEATFSGASFAGAGLLKSTDAGASWQLLASGTFGGSGFSDLRVDPTNPDVLLAATTGAAFAAAFPPTGVFKSTDGGVIWSLKLAGQASDLEVDPTNFSRQFAGLGSPGEDSANGVYRSTDGGDTWTLVGGPWSTLPGGVGRVELAIAPSSTSTLYASIQDAFNGVGNDAALLGLWKTTNAWDATPTWVEISTTPTGVRAYCGAWFLNYAQCWYDHDILVHRTNPNFLFAGGITLWAYTGTNWIEISQTASPSTGIHIDQQSMALAGSRFIVGNDGGVWSTTNNGSSWIDHNTNLSITQFYDGSLHPTNPSFALGGSQDNGTERWTGSTTWPWVSCCDGADSAISSVSPDTHWQVSAQELVIYRTRDGSTIEGAGSGIDRTGAPFIAPVEKCPANDDIFIAGTNNLWKTTNFFTADNPSWLANSPELGTGISALAFAASDTGCNTYAGGTFAGQLLLTTNGGVTGVDLDPANHVPNRWVTAIEFNPSDANELYVTLSGFDEGTPGQPGHVFKATGALSGSPVWSNVSPPVNIPHNTVVVDPFDPGIVYVGADIGVWRSSNGGASWTHMGPETGMPNVAVYDLENNHATGKLVAFTHGRGAFELAQIGSCPGGIERDSDADARGDSCDNCPSAFNPGQEDLDGDGVGDVCDPDGDADGFDDAVDCNDANAAVNPAAAEVCNGADDNCNLAVDEGFDVDTDGYTSCGGDCDDASAAVWGTPGEVLNLLFAANKETLRWTSPANPGGAMVLYDTLRSESPGDFVGAAICLETDEGTDTSSVDTLTPTRGTVFSYLIRAENACPSGQGSLGADSLGAERSGRNCP